MINIPKEKYHHDQKVFLEFKRLYNLINHSILYKLQTYKEILLLYQKHLKFYLVIKNLNY